MARPIKSLASARPLSSASFRTLDGAGREHDGTPPVPPLEIADEIVGDNGRSAAAVGLDPHRRMVQIHGEVVPAGTARVSHDSISRSAVEKSPAAIPRLLASVSWTAMGAV